MSALTQSDHISFQGLKEEYKRTNPSTFKADVMAGLQVAVLTLPQAMAYSLAAELPLSCGIFAAIFSSLAAVFFSSSRYLIAGPVNTVAILIQASVAEILNTSFRDLGDSERGLLSVQIMVQLGFLVATIQILTAVFKLGRLTQFVSQSVILGYVGGTVAAVVIGQLYVIAGMYPDNEADTIFGKGLALFSGFKEIHIPSLIVGAFSFVSIILLKRINKLFPAGLITIVLAALIVYFFNHFIMSEHLQEVYVVGGTDGPFSLIPPLNFPLLEPRLINQMLPIAFAISLLGILETTCVTKSMAVKSGERTSVNQEILSVGVGNLVSSFLGAMPISVSPSRSALNYECRPQTRFAAIFNALFVALFVSVFAFFVNIIPLPTLSALLLITSIGLINWPQILLVLKATRSDRWVLIITFVSCLFFSLDNAFYIGVLLAIVSYLRKAAVPQVVEFAIQESGELKSLALSSACELKPIRVIKVEGELFFGAADVFENSLKSTFEDDTTTKVIILQLKNARDIDATACLALLQLNESLRKRGCHLLIAGLTYPVWDVLSFSGVVDSMGKENLFLFDPENPHHNLQQALSRAKLLSC